MPSLGLSSYLLAGLLAALMASVVYSAYLHQDREKVRADLAQCHALDTLRNAEIDTWKQQATNQTQRTKEANKTAAAERKRRQKAFAAIEAEKVPATCTGSMQWIKDKDNKLVKWWNDEP